MKNKANEYENLIENFAYIILSYSSVPWEKMMTIIR